MRRLGLFVAGLNRMIHFPPWAIALVAAAVFAPPAAATVTSSTRSVQYSPSVPTTVFSVTFHFLSADHIKVTKTTIASGAAVILTRGVDYSVTMPLGATAGSVTTTASVTSTHRITIERVVPITQATSFKTQGAFRPASHEDAFDKLTMIAQQIQAVAGSDGTTAVDTHVGLADPHTQYAILAGRASGQHLRGGTASGENLQLSSTAHATKGKILIGNAGTSAFDDVNLRLGIGTASPSVPLDIVGAGAISTGLTTPILYGSAASGGDLTLYSTSHATKGNIFFGTSTYDEVNNRLGIGTTSPAAPLAVVGAGTFTTTLTVPTYYGSSSSGGDLTLMSTSNATKGNLFFGTSTYDEVNNRLGIATTSPSSTLHVVGTGLISNSLTVPTLYGSTDSGGELTIYSTTHATKGTINFGSSGYDEANNRLGIGTSTPTNELEVNGQISGRRYTVYDAGVLYNLDPTYECNGVFFDSDTDGTLQLPEITSSVDGCEVTLFNSSGGGKRIKLSPNAADKIRGTCGAVAATGTVNKDFWNTGATADDGDNITVVATDGPATNAWFIQSCTGIWAEEP